MDRAVPSLFDIGYLKYYTRSVSVGVSQHTIDRIIILRREGRSLSEIAKEVGVGYGTAFRYCKGVKVLTRFRKIWLAKRGGSTLRKKLAEDKALSDARRVITSLSLKEKLIFLSALYWGEGSKEDFGLSNTDPELIRIFVAGLKEIFGVAIGDLSIGVRVYEDLDKERCLEFWSGLVGVPVERFVSVTVLKGRKHGKLPYGMCRIRVKKGGKMLKYLKAVRGVIGDFFVDCPCSSMDRAAAS